MNGQANKQKGMERLKKSTLHNVYFQSRNMMMGIYVILVFVMTVLSDNKFPIFVFATSIPLILILSETVYKTEVWNPYYVSIPLCITLTTFYELYSTLNEPFWLFFIIIIYHNILFIEKDRFKMLFIGISVILLFWVEYYTDMPAGIIASRVTATIIFSITTYLGFDYLLKKQLEVHVALRNKDEAEKKLQSYAADLEKKNSELDQFAYIVSHDLKAPLRGINNLSSWIEEDLGQNITEDTHKNLELLRNRVHRMENLINGILAYSRAGRLQTDEVYFSTYELINEICANLINRSDITVNIVQPLPFLKTERVKLEQVFTNLISNALKHTQNEHPEIRITSQEDDSSYTFCVADNGPGIDPAYHEKIFIIFQTLQSRDTVENTGVGLAIVKKIVEDNGGAIWVESTVGNGAQFYFTWPK
jgi:signal transduction histidine kinase